MVHLFLSSKTQFLKIFATFILNFSKGWGSGDGGWVKHSFQNINKNIFDSGQTGLHLTRLTFVVVV